MIDFTRELRDRAKGERSAMSWKVKILDSQGRPVSTDPVSSQAKAHQVAKGYSRMMPRSCVYVVDPDGKIEIYKNGQRVTLERQLEIPLPVEVPKPERILRLDFEPQKNAKRKTL